MLVAGPHLKVLPPRFGRDQVRAVVSAAAAPPPSEGLGRSDLAAAIDRVARDQPPAWVRRRRRPTSPARTGSTRSPASASATTCSPSPCTTRASGTSRRSASSTSSTRPPAGTARCGCTAAVQRRFAAAAAERIDARELALRRAGAEHLELATDTDWLGEIVRHVRRQRVQAVNAQVLRRP